MPEHRRQEIVNRVWETLELLIARGVTHFYAGGANGFDLWFSCTVLSLKKMYSHITLSILLPNKDYTGHWSSEDRMAASYVLSHADEVETVPSFGKEPALARNDALIARGSTCVAYLRDNLPTRRGGTAYTVRHASRVGCQIYMIAKIGDYTTERNRL